MPKEFHRSERVSELLHRIISDVVRSELRDPRVRLVTITDVQLSRDLSVAKIYFTAMDDQADLDEIATVLGRAAGFIRSQVGREVRLRITPELRFYKDEAELHGRRIGRLINDNDHSNDDQIESTDSISAETDVDSGKKDDGQTT